jgi:hypothetical protein
MDKRDRAVLSSGFEAAVPPEDPAVRAATGESVEDEMMFDISCKGSWGRES